jgi:chromosome segregation ATPase
MIKFGNSSARDKELTEEMRAVLAEMKSEREKFERLIDSSATAVERLTALEAPIVKAAGDVDEVVSRLDATERRFDAVGALAGQVGGLEEKIQFLVAGHEDAMTQITSAVTDAHEVRTVFEELKLKVDLAEDLRTRLDAFLEVEKPFKLLLDEAQDIRGQIDSTTEQLGRLREQHDRLMDTHKTATQKMEALDRRRDELSRDLTDKERRVVAVEHIVKEMDAIRQTVNDTKRSMGTLKTLTDSVAQKTSAVEAQRDAVDRALAQADALEREMRQLDAAVRQQQDNEKSLAALADQVAVLQTLHQDVLDRSTEIQDVQRQSTEQTGAIRDAMGAARDEVKNAVERLEFEARGLESVSHRVADLRSALTEFEGRFRELTNSAETVRELTAQTRILEPQIAALREDAAKIDGDVQQLNALRHGLTQAEETATNLADRLAQAEQTRPAVEAALRDVEKLSGTHATVKDAIERARLAHGELERMIVSQSETRSWLLETERALGDLRTRVGTLDAELPRLSVVESQAQRIHESISSLETRRAFLDELHSGLAEVTALSGTLDERGQELRARMDSAEQRFLHLAEQAEEADRLAHTIANVQTSVHDAERRGDAVSKAIESIEKRTESVEALADATRTLREEIAQRKTALDEAAKDLERASKLRREAAQTAEELGGLAEKLDASLATAQERSTKLDTTASQLESRTKQLKSVDGRLTRFEQKLAQWDVTEQQVSRALEQIASRQSTVQAVQADLDRMIAMSETTSENVRAITSAHRELAESRALLNDVSVRLSEIRDVADGLDARERQMAKAEERLARAEGFLDDVRSSLETLQGNKALVDQAVERVGSLRVLLKHADAMIEGLRDERKMTTDVQDAMSVVEGTGESSEDDGEMSAAA